LISGCSFDTTFGLYPHPTIFVRNEGFRFGWDFVDPKKMVHLILAVTWGIRILGGGNGRNFNPTNPPMTSRLKHAKFSSICLRYLEQK